MKRKITAIILMVALVLALALPMASVGASPGPGIVGLWHFDEGSGTTASDSSGNSNDGTIYGTASWTGSGMFDGALTFDGIDDYVEVAHDDSLDMTSAYTLEAWVNVTDVPSNIYRPILFRATTDANDIEVYVQAISNDLIVAHNRGNGGTFDYVGFVDPPIGTWFHLAVTFDGTDVRAYYDSTAQAVTKNTTAMVAPLDTDKGWWIGKVDHTSFGTLLGGSDINLFKGTIDEVRIWDEALTAGQIGQSASLEDVEITKKLTRIEWGDVVIEDEDGIPGVPIVPTETLVTFTMDITVTNNSLVPLSNVVVKDNLGGDLMLVSTDDGVNSFNDWARHSAERHCVVVW